MSTRKNISGIISSVLVFSMVFTTAVYANENWIPTDHNTYIDKETNLEYYVDTKLPVTAEHMSTCVHYQNYLLSLPPVQNVEPIVDPIVEEKVEENVDTTVEEVVEDNTKVEPSVEPSIDTPETAEQTLPEMAEEAAATEAKEEKDKSKPQVDLSKTMDLYKANTWYHPAEINPQGYVGEIKRAILKDNFVTSNWDAFKVSSNPFALGQCTYFAWSRFYQVYGFDCGARSSGKYNAAEVVKAHSEDFELSSTPSAGAIYSIEKNTLFPEHGHVGFIEAFDGEYIWISEGNVLINDHLGNVWIHKVKWEDFKASFPDATFAVPKEESNLAKKIAKVELPKREISLPRIQLNLKH